MARSPATLAERLPGPPQGGPAPPARPPRRLGRVLLVGVGLRLALVPFHHPWDLQTFAATWADLGHGRNPYERMERLTEATASHRGTTYAPHYEYFAYPPGLLYVDFPLARLYTALHPDFEPPLSVQNRVPLAPVPLDFLLLFKLPLIASDVAIFVLLSRMAGARAGRRFFLNPYVILVTAAWMFESLVALALLLAVRAGKRSAWGAAGGFLAAGALLKFVPAFALPAFLVTAWREDGPRAAARLVGGAAAVAVPLALPFLPGIRDVVAFHASRLGGGLSVFEAFRIVPAFRSGLLLEPHAVSAALGAATLVAAVAGSTALLLLRRLTLERAVIVSVAAFFLGSKLVNEQYPFVLLPLLLLAMARSPRRDGAVAYSLTWSLPLAFAVLNVPIVMFLAPLGGHLVPDLFGWLVDSRVGLIAVRPFLQVRLIALMLLALAFAWTMVMLLRVHGRSEAVPRALLQEVPA